MHDRSECPAEHRAHVQARSEDAARAARAERGAVGHHLGDEQRQQQLPRKPDPERGLDRRKARAVYLREEPENQPDQQPTHRRLEVVGEFPRAEDVLRPIQQAAVPDCSPANQRAHQKVQRQLAGTDEVVGRRHECREVAEEVARDHA